MNTRLYIRNHIFNRRTFPAVVISTLLMCMYTVEISAVTNSFDYSVVLDTTQLYEITEVGGDGENYSKILWNGMTSEGVPGAPELPVKYLKFFVPTYCKGISVQLKSAMPGIVLTPSYDPYPGQEPQPSNLSEAIWTAPEEELYNTSVTTPSLSVKEESFLDGFNHVVTVAVSPVVYSANDSTLTGYGDITFTVSYEECGEEEMETKPIIPRQYRPYFSLDNGIIDPLGIRQSNARRFASSTTSTASNAGYYYIITPESLKDALLDLKTWKAQKGYQVELVTIDSILTMPGFSVDSTQIAYGNKLVDEAACLRAYLTREFQDKGFFHCLLVGNYKTSMPIRKFISSNVNKIIEGNPFSEGLIPSDWYFTNLTRMFNLSKDYHMPIYLSILPSGFSSDISVGRLLCSTPEEIGNWFYKLKLYEANPGYGDNDYLGKTLFFEQAQDFIGCSNQLRTMLTNYFDSIIYCPDKQSEIPPSFGPTGAEIIEEISKVGLSHWYGHGVPPGIAVATGKYNITSEDSVYNLIKPDDADLKDELRNGLDNLMNFRKPSVVYSISCDNNPFDYMVASYGNKIKSWECRYNLGEAFTVANKSGGPLFLGNTRWGWVISSSTLENYFFEGILQNREIGFAENYSKFQSSQPHLCATHSIIGDPEMELWIGKPKDLEVYIEYANNSVYLEGDQLEGATMCFYDGLGHSTSYKVDSDEVYFSLLDLPGEFDKKSIVVSVWKTGYLPTIRLFGHNTYETSFKKFIVRDAELGYQFFVGSSEDYIIGNGGNLEVKALDKITVKHCFSVDNGGVVELECDNDVFLDGGTVKSGGTMKVTGKRIVIGKNFTVEKGGNLILTTSI